MTPFTPAYGQVGLSTNAPKRKGGEVIGGITTESLDGYVKMG